MEDNCKMSIQNIVDSSKSAKNYNVIECPYHYNSGGIEVWDYIEDQKLNYFLGNAVKYISRAGKKDPNKYVEDLQKAVAYIQKEINNQLKRSDS